MQSIYFSKKYTKLVFLPLRTDSFFCKLLDHTNSTHSFIELILILMFYRTMHCIVYLKKKTTFLVLIFLTRCLDAKLRSLF